MIIGVFAEGRADLAVITNILKGALNIDRSDLKYELPEFEFDQTDLHTMNLEQHSSWTVVKKVCQEKDRINNFLMNTMNQNAFIVVQLDTAERHLADYNVLSPEKNKEISDDVYCQQLRDNVIAKINEWTNNLYSEKTAYAIAIEEIDAWVYTIYQDEKTDTSKYRKPKEELHNKLNIILRGNQKSVLKEKAYDKYYALSYKFRKESKLKIYANKNESLKLFIESLDKFKPLIENN